VAAAAPRRSEPTPGIATLACYREIPRKSRTRSGAQDKRFSHRKALWVRKSARRKQSKRPHHPRCQAPSLARSALGDCDGRSRLEGFGDRRSAAPWLRTGKR